MQEQSCDSTVATSPGLIALSYLFSGSSSPSSSESCIINLPYMGRNLFFFIAYTTNYYMPYVQNIASLDLHLTDDIPDTFSHVCVDANRPRAKAFRHDCLIEV